MKVFLPQNAIHRVPCFFFVFFVKFTSNFRIKIYTILLTVPQNYSFCVTQTA